MSLARAQHRNDNVNLWLLYSLHTSPPRRPTDFSKPANNHLFILSGISSPVTHRSETTLTFICVPNPLAQQAWIITQVVALLPSPGTAVVTQKKAALWTDSRYWVQAEREMDCNWDLEKDGGCGRSICLCVCFIMTTLCYDTWALLARVHRICADNCRILSRDLSDKNSSLQKPKWLQVKAVKVTAHPKIALYTLFSRRATNHSQLF